MTGEVRYRRPDNIVFREEDDGAILFNADNGAVHVLEDLGWVLYHNFMDKGTTRAEMLAALKQHYPDQSAETLEKDLDTFLQQLRENGCVEEVTAG